MSKTEELTSKWKGHKDHLNKTFLEELAYRLWSTKGARFAAAHRLLARDKWSTLSLGFLSAYLIIYGLLAVYQVSNTDSAIFDPKIIAFSSTTISILLLVFTQYEASQSYKLRSSEFHRCALEISALHDEIRLFKTIGEKTIEEKTAFCKDLANRYQLILQSYTNHDDIDYKVFTIKHSEYYGLSFINSFSIRCRSYFKTKFIYHLLIGLPAILAILFGR